jgi:serine/threonine protein kinase
MKLWLPSCRPQLPHRLPLTSARTDGNAGVISLQVKCIMKQLLRGLAYVHGNGVLHRDLKVQPRGWEEGGTGYRGGGQGAAAG